MLSALYTLWNGDPLHISSVDAADINPRSSANYVYPSPLPRVASELYLSCAPASRPPARIVETFTHSHILSKKSFGSLVSLTDCFSTKMHILVKLEEELFRAGHPGDKFGRALDCCLRELDELDTQHSRKEKIKEMCPEVEEIQAMLERTRPTTRSKPAMKGKS